MTCLVNELLERAQALVTQENAYLDATRIIPVRKELVVMSRNEELTLFQRRALLMMAEACKWAINCHPVRSIDVKPTLYGHGSLTSECRTKPVVKLLSAFVFNPAPLAIGVRHFLR